MQSGDGLKTQLPLSMLGGSVRAKGDSTVGGGGSLQRSRYWDVTQHFPKALLDILKK